MRLPPDAARLLTTMFSQSAVCQRSVGSLVAQGFDERTARQLLRALTDAGFLSKEPARRGFGQHLPATSAAAEAAMKLRPCQGLIALPG